MKKESFQENGYDVRLTCESHPEQYDVLRKSRNVGYIRLRHGVLHVWCPDAGLDSECVYLAETGYGEFDDDESRGFHMRKALKAIDDWYCKNRRGK